jgi:hypothetical protein
MRINYWQLALLCSSRNLLLVETLSYINNSTVIQSEAGHGSRAV